jgi:ankyrin repeat protein
LWDWSGRTPLYIAIDRREAVIAPLKTGLLALDIAIRDDAPPVPVPGQPSISSLEIIRALLDAGVDVNAQLNMHRPSRRGNVGRFVEEFYNTGCTPLMRATISGDVEVVRLLLDKGASPNISAMGLTPFLVAAGVGTGGRGSGLASATHSGGPVDTALMDLLLAHGADVNAQVTGTTTYSLRISRAPSATEGMTALHVAAQQGRIEEVRYLLAKGAKTELLDANGRKPIDLAGAGTGQSAATSSNVAVSAATPAAGAPGSSPGGGPASAAETRSLLQNAAAQR